MHLKRTKFVTSTRGFIDGLTDRAYRNRDSYSRYYVSLLQVGSPSVGTTTDYKDDYSNGYHAGRKLRRPISNSVKRCFLLFIYAARIMLT
jgi:hypothetical protein